MLHWTGGLNPAHTRFTRHSMNEDQTPLLEDVEGSNGGNSPRLVNVPKLLT